MYEKCRNCEYICTCCLSRKYCDCCSGCENDHDEFKPAKNIRFCPLDGNKIECEGGTKYDHWRENKIIKGRK